MSTIAISIPFTYPYALSFFHIHQLINIVAIVVSFLEFVACLHTSYTHRMIGFKLIGITFSIFFAKLFWFFSNCCTYFISRIRGMHCFNYSNTNTKITSHTHKYFVSREYYSFVVFFLFFFLSSLCCLVFRSRETICRLSMCTGFMVFGLHCRSRNIVHKLNRTHIAKKWQIKILKFSESPVCVALLFSWWMMNRISILARVFDRLVGRMDGRAIAGCLLLVSFVCVKNIN